jgi:hypothetical protein
MKWCFYICLFLISSGVVAQTSQFVDSIKLDLKKKPSFSYNYGTRNSFIQNRKAVVNQYQLGLAFGDNFGLGAGYNTLRFPDFIFVSKTNNFPPVDVYWAHLNYVAIYAEYTFYRTKKWIFTIPVQIGAGQYYERKISLDKNPKLNRHFALIYEPTMKGTFKINKYFGLGADVGYRILLAGNREIKNFNSPIYVFSFKIFYGALYEEFKKRTGWKLP